MALTPNFLLNLLSSRQKGWHTQMNANLTKLGKLFCVDNAGDFWIVRNAIYDPDTDTWSQTDTGKASTAMRMNTDGTVTMLKCATGNPTITWSNALAWNDLIFPNGYIDAQGMKITGLTDLEFTGLLKPSSVICVASDDVIFEEPGSGVSAGGATTEITIPSFVASGSVIRYRFHGEYINPGASGPIYLYKNGSPVQTKTMYGTYGDSWEVLETTVVGGDIVKLVTSAYTAIYAWSLGASPSLIDNYGKGVWVAAQP